MLANTAESRVWMRTRLLSVLYLGGETCEEGIYSSLAQVPKIGVFFLDKWEKMTRFGEKNKIALDSQAKTIKMYL